MNAKVAQTTDMPKAALSLGDQPSKTEEFKALSFDHHHRMILEELATMAYTMELWGKFSNDSDASGIVTEVHLSRMNAIADFYRAKLPVKA